MKKKTNLLISVFTLCVILCAFLQIFASQFKGTINAEDILKYVGQDGKGQVSVELFSHTAKEKELKLLISDKIISEPDRKVLANVDLDCDLQEYGSAEAACEAIASFTAPSNGEYYVYIVNNSQKAQGYELDINSNR